MAGAVKTLSFFERQADIPVCRMVYLKFAEGDVRAEYLSGSETHVDTTWQYTFLVQEEDLVGSLTLADIKECNIISPYFECFDEEAEEPDPEDCPARQIRCFDAIPIIDTLVPGDHVAILRHDEECDTFCLAAMSPYEFFEQAAEPPEDA
jgi:hypothetical protein